MREEKRDILMCNGFNREAAEAEQERIRRDLAENEFLDWMNPREEEINERLLNLENRTRNFQPFGQNLVLRRIITRIEKLEEEKKSYQEKYTY